MYEDPYPHHGVQIVIILLLLSRLVGWHASIGGFLTSVLLIPAASALMKRVGTVRQRLAPLTDARVKLCSEIVAGDRWASQVVDSRSPVSPHPPAKPWLGSRL